MNPHERPAEFKWGDGPDTEQERAERQRIERDARLRDALDALMTATLWVNRTADFPGPEDQKAESWRRKARSGIVGLDAALAHPSDAAGERCGNCHHGKDDHSSRGAEICGVPWCQCPGFLTTRASRETALDGLDHLLGDILRKYGGTMKGRGDHDIFDALVRYRAALTEQRDET